MSPPQTEEFGTPRWRNLDRGQGWKLPSPWSLLPCNGLTRCVSRLPPLSTEEVLVEFGDMENCPAHTLTAMSEYELASGGYYEELKDIFSKDLIYFFGEVNPKPPVPPDTPVAPTTPVCPEFPPNLPLPPPHSTSPSAPPSLMSFSPSAPPTGQLDMPRVFGPSAPSYTEDPLSPPQTSAPPAPPRSVDTSAPPWLLPPSAPPETIAIRLLRAPSSIRLRLGQLSTCLHLRLRLAPPSPDSAFVLGPTGSASDLWISGSSSDARCHGSSSVSRTIG